jgi:adenosylmethionine-8-amino-7-oxononanoate aminotransferase
LFFDALHLNVDNPWRRFMTTPRSGLLPRSFRKEYPIAVRGEGVYLWDAKGQRYLDFASSAVVSFIGHCDKTVRDAIECQLDQIEFAHTTQFITQPALDLANEVLAFAGDAFEGGAVFFTSGGSEAIESGLKLARQYQVEIGQASRFRILSRKQAYHGATLGAMSVSGNRRRREIYLPMLRADEQVNTPYCYRCHYSCDHCGDRYSAEVEHALDQMENEPAAFIFEPVSGATLGAAVPPKGYLSNVAAICKAKRVLLIADEVMTGFGRTGRNFAVDHWGVTPDIIVAGKGIASGYAPLGAVIANKKVVDAIANGSGALIHGFTYNAHPLSMAAGRAVLRKIQSDGLVYIVQRTETSLRSALSELLELQSVGDVRGIGLLWAAEFISDKNSKAPFPPDIGFAPKVAAAAAKRGVLVYPMQGCVDGLAGDHILIAPPAIITSDQIQFAVAELNDAIEEVEKSL